MSAIFLFLALLAGAALTNEALTLSGSAFSDDFGRSRNIISAVEREATKADIMATMTVEKAYGAFMKMNHSKLDKAVVAMIEEKLGGTDKQKKQVPNTIVAAYSAVDTARDMLNGMMNEAVMNKELEGIRCSEYENKQLKMIRSIENEITYANAEASAAKSEVLRASEVISILEEVQLPKNRQELVTHNDKCKLDIAALKQQLSIVMSDIAVMKRILSMVCADDVRTVTPAFLETEESSDQGSIGMCISCLSGQQAAWFKHTQVQPLLAHIKSAVAKEYIEDNLLAEFDTNTRRRPAEVSTVFLENIPGIDIGMNTTKIVPKEGKCNEQILADNSTTYRGCQTETVNGNHCQKWSVQSPHEHTFTADNHPLAGLGDHNYCRNPDNSEAIWCFTDNPEVPRENCEPMLELKVPSGVAKHECVETNACKLAKSDCKKLKDRFLVIMAGIVDKKSELSDSLDKLEDTCQTIKGQFEDTITSQEGQLKEEQTSFASATKSLQENQKLSETSNEQHAELGADYKKTMTTCCENKNGFTGEICALEKIRGELYKMEGIAAYIIDCEVSDWTDEECSVSCGGGKQDRTRSILIHPQNGTECPPVKMERSCNLDGCPIDCQVDDWSLWSDCTAECAGGVKSRSRSKTVEPEHGGEACPEQSETRECNGQSCNADCVLSDWQAWSLCSKACDSGNEQRRKKVTEEARGQGVCAGDDDETRLGFKECNTFECSELLPRGRSTLKCSAMLDLIILLDGSGSLGKYGWKQSKKMAKQLVKAMVAGEHSVQLSFLLFSGPDDYSILEACAGTDPSVTKPPAATDCGIYWISHMTQDTKGLVKQIDAMKWPGKTTLTSYALSEAKAELLQGRQDAQSVVVVITDGKPMSPIKTGKASADIKQSARLIYIPVGKGVTSTVDKMKEWCSKPPQDNVVIVDTLSELSTPKTLNNMISSFCNQVE